MEKILNLENARHGEPIEYHTFGEKIGAFLFILFMLIAVWLPFIVPAVICYLMNK